MEIRDTDIHNHLKARMLQRGVTAKEIEITINEGWDAEDLKIGTHGKVFIFPYNTYWEEKFYEEKEVTVYYKIKEGRIILLTAKARYGKEFAKGG